MKLYRDCLCLFATRDMKQGEELLYDYGLNSYPWKSNLNSRGKSSDQKDDTKEECGPAMVDSDRADERSQGVCEKTLGGEEDSKEDDCGPAMICSDHSDERCSLDILEKTVGGQEDVIMEDCGLQEDDTKEECGPAMVDSDRADERCSPGVSEKKGRGQEDVIMEDCGLQEDDTKEDCGPAMVDSDRVDERCSPGVSEKKGGGHCSCIEEEDNGISLQGNIPHITVSGKSTLTEKVQAEMVDDIIGQRMRKMPLSASFLNISNLDIHLVD
ncbi:uncharacterized protein LOC134232359 isoform X1 [Saccostrea cucullata]|uniref:uncharacterized protein LOC134232359 isoform X1 n=1 Tax=Saccostrea cuccullata TaxID=36930 RepID=UPI002ED2CE2B